MGDQTYNSRHRATRESPPRLLQVLEGAQCDSSRNKAALSGLAKRNSSLPAPLMTVVELGPFIGKSRNGNARLVAFCTPMVSVKIPEDGSLASSGEPTFRAC